MTFKILSPEEAAKRSRAKREAWEKRQEIEEKRKEIEARKARSEAGKAKAEPESIHEESWIRGPKLSVLISRSNGVPFEEGLARADTDNRVIASNKRMSQALVRNQEWRTIIEVFACWTGTITAYTKPGEKLGKAVEYIEPVTKYRWVFPVPEAYRDKKDAIIVAEHPDYSLEIDGKTRIVRAAQVDLIERFPAKNGRYLGDSKHDIPSGDSVQDDWDTRYLYRMDTRVGPVARGYNLYYRGDRRSVCLKNRPSVGRGVAVVACPVSGVEFPVTKVK